MVQVVQTEVTKKQPDEIAALSREGAYVNGLYLEGAPLDSKSPCIPYLLVALRHAGRLTRQCSDDGRRAYVSPLAVVL